MKFAALVSGGKDSLFAAHYMAMQGWEPVVLVRVLPKISYSYMFHTVNLHVVEKQAECAQLPLETIAVGGQKELEVEELAAGLRRLSQKHGFDSLVVGAISSEYQRVRLDRACEEAGLKCFSPLWHKKPLTLFEAYLEHGFKFIFSGVYALGFDQSWVGRLIDKQDLEKLVRLNKKYGVSIVGEGGEYESLVLDSPMFQAKRLRVWGKAVRLGPYSYEFRVSSVEAVPKGSGAEYVCAG